MYQLKTYAPIACAGADGSNRKGGYLGLAEAILSEAVDEYIDALLEDDTFRIINNERFFLSRWGQELSFSQGEIIIRNCKQIAMQRTKETG